MKEILLNIESDEYTLGELISILELTAYKTGIDNISGMARIENRHTINVC